MLLCNEIVFNIAFTFSIISQIHRKHTPKKYYSHKKTICLPDSMDMLETPSVLISEVLDEVLEVETAGHFSLTNLAVASS